jgi:DNA-binding NtrC family response regulator
MTLKRRARILAIDDVPAVTEWLKTVLEGSGYEVSTAATGERGGEVAKTWRPDAVVTDLLLPDVDGAELVRSLKQLDPDLQVIVLTGQGSIPRSVEAVKAGAFDFLEKPVDPDLLLDRVEKAIKQKTLIDENARLKQRLDHRGPLSHIVGKSEKMRGLFDLIDSVAASDANILIHGENGTGKELVADAIHQASNRSKRPFIKINCAAIPADLIESELFGYKKGAFTGATLDKEGLFQMAEGGSLLLDEIGEMPLYLQTKLLRVLQEREYRPIGSDRIVHVDFRLICATNADVDAARRDGKLREDLYFRINTISLRVPPLRERAEDIPLLCEHFLDKYRQQYQKDVKALEPAVHRILMRNRWPGNVRELGNVIERAVLVAKGAAIAVGDLPELLRKESSTDDFVVPPDRTLADIEKMALLQTLQRTNWNKLEAAQILGLYRPTLYSKLKKYQIPVQLPSNSAVAATSTRTIAQPSAHPPRSSRNTRHPRPAAARRRDRTFTSSNGRSATLASAPTVPRSG